MDPPSPPMATVGAGLAIRLPRRPTLVDGWRTPTIEDIEKHAANPSGYFFTTQSLSANRGTDTAESENATMTTTGAELALERHALEQDGTATRDKSENGAGDVENGIADGRGEDKMRRGRRGTKVLITGSLAERIQHFTWANFTSSMATGGMANVLWAGLSLFLCYQSNPILNIIQCLCSLIPLVRD